MPTSERSARGQALSAWLGALAVVSPIFPPAIADDLGADEPSCTVCHSTPSGGLGTATTAFARYLVSRGLRAGDESSLRGALAAAEGEKHDTDGDGVIDVDALRAGNDPNGGSNLPEPKYGCSAAVAHGAVASWLDQLFPLLLIGLALGVRRSLRSLRFRHRTNPTRGTT